MEVAEEAEVANKKKKEKNSMIEMIEWDTGAHCSAGLPYLHPEAQADSPWTPLLLAEHC